MSKGSKAKGAAVGASVAGGSLRDKIIPKNLENTRDRDRHLRTDITTFCIGCILGILIAIVTPNSPISKLLWTLSVGGFLVYPALHGAESIARWRSWSTLKLRIVFIVLTIVSVLACAHWQWDNRPLTVRLVFKTSPALTENRKKHISRALDDYYRYLAKDVGFDLPKEIPPIQLSKGSLILSGLSDPGILETSQLIIPEDPRSSSDSYTSVAAYSGFTFTRLLYWSRHSDPDLAYRGAGAWIYSCYYRGSFTNTKDVCDGPNQEWRDGLWEARKYFGQTYVDKLLFYTYRMWGTTPSKAQTFDAYFFGRITNGLTVVSGEPTDHQKLKQILQENGVHLE